MIYWMLAQLFGFKIPAAGRGSARRREFPPDKSVYDDFADHHGVDGAEITVRAGLGELVGKRVVGVHRLRSEGLVLFFVTGHRVRHVVVVGPSHGRPDGHRDSDWQE